jgi:septum formation protein
MNNLNVMAEARLHADLKSPPPLYIASKSSSRKMLLEQMGINFTVIEQNADESKCDWSMPLQRVVENIAQYKMDHALMPIGQEGEIAFVLTADTLGEDTTGAVTGKPTDVADAIEKIKRACGRNRCGTAFCLEKKIYQDGKWRTQQRIVRYVEASFEFDIPHDLIAEYIRVSGALETAGAIKIEGYGAQFFKSINGSYSTIVGLPLFELRAALTQLGFY